jgi:hypothetical protein
MYKVDGVGCAVRFTIFGGKNSLHVEDRKFMTRFHFTPGVLRLGHSGTGLVEVSRLLKEISQVSCEIG